MKITKYILSIPILIIVPPFTLPNNPVGCPDVSLIVRFKGKKKTLY